MGVPGKYYCTLPPLLLLVTMIGKVLLCLVSLLLLSATASAEPLSETQIYQDSCWGHSTGNGGWHRCEGVHIGDEGMIDCIGVWESKDGGTCTGL